MNNLHIPKKTMIKVFCLSTIAMVSLGYFIISSLGDGVVAPLTHLERGALIIAITTTIMNFTIIMIGFWKVMRPGYHQAVTGDWVSHVDDVFNDLGLWDD